MIEARLPRVSSVKATDIAEEKGVAAEAPDIV
jgi:hypothetical protein